MCREVGNTPPMMGWLSTGFPALWFPPASMATQRQLRNRCPQPKGEGRKEKNSRKGSARVRAFFVDPKIKDILSVHTNFNSRKRLAMRMVVVAVGRFAISWGQYNSTYSAKTRHWCT